jgi:hypothetical protein
MIVQRTDAGTWYKIQPCIPLRSETVVFAAMNIYEVVWPAGCLSVSTNQSINQSTNLSICLPAYLPTHPPTYIPTYPPTYLPIRPSMCLICLSVRPSIHPSTYLPTYLPTNMYLLSYVCTYLLICMSTSLPVCLSVWHGVGILLMFLVFYCESRSCVVTPLFVYKNFHHGNINCGYYDLSKLKFFFIII